MRRFIYGLILYYVLGFIVLNAFTLVKYIAIGDFSGALPAVINENIMTQQFWKVILIWPLYLSLYNK